jgi:hypothetical protein
MTVALSGHPFAGKRLALAAYRARLLARPYRRFFPLGTTLNTLIEAGFQIRRVEEFSSMPQQIQAMPQLAEELEHPMMLLVSAS